MNKKHFMLAFIFVLVSAAIGAGAWLYSNWRDSLSVTGEPTFAATKAKMAYLGKITITDPDGNEITLSRQNGIWHFEEAKNYFANLRQINNLLLMLNGSAIIATDETDARQLEQRGLDAKSGILLQTYTLDGKILDRMIIGNKDKNNTCYARQPQVEKYTHRISDCKTFSGQAADWIPFPLLSLPHHLIDRIKTAEKELNRREIEQQILTSSEMRRLILALGAIDYQGIVLREEMSDNPDFEPETRTLEVEMADGLVYVLNIHRVGDVYWLEPDLKVGKIAKKTVPDFIAKNRQYYDKWLFQLDDAQGKLLFDFKG